MFNDKSTVTRSIAIRDCGTKSFEVRIYHSTSNSWNAVIAQYRNQLEALHEVVRVDNSGAQSVRGRKKVGNHWLK